MTGPGGAETAGPVAAGPRARRWLLVAAGALAGIPVGSALAPGATARLLLAALLVILLGILLRRRGGWGREGTLAVAALLGFAALGNGRLSGGRADCAGALAKAEGRVVRVRLRLTGFPSVGFDGSRRVEMALEELEGRALEGPIGLLRVGGVDAGRADGWLPGERFLATGLFREMEDAGPFDRLGPPRVSIWAKSAQLVQPFEAGHGLAGAAGELNAELFGQLKRIEQAGPGRSEGSALVAALLLGRAGEIDPESRSLFRRTGLAHLLSISGLHVALLLALADRLGAALGLGIRVRLAIGGAIALFFVPFAGASPPLVRAAAVAVLFAAARLLERPVSPLPILALAAAVELAARPEHLFDAGFQLTYAAAAGLALAASPLARRFARLPRFLAGALAATFAAELAVAPLVLARFGALPLAGFAANVLLVPLFLLAAALGAAALLLGNVSSPLAGGLLGWSSAITRAGEAGLGRFADLPLALLRPSPAGGWLLAAGCAGLFVLAALRRPFPGWLVLPPAALCVAGALVRPAGPRPGELRVAALDVGQGDAILVRSARATMLVDGGGSARVSPESFAETVLLPALARRGVRRLDRVVLTHPHPDHCVGLLGLLKEERVGELVLPAVPDLGGCLADLRTAAAARGTPIVTAKGGDRLPLGDLAIDVLAPGRDRMEWTKGEANERSLVMRVSNDGGTALLAGDLQSWGEHELVEAGGALRADLLKVSHHGSRTSSSEPFLDAVHPRVAVVSCGRRNVYGHPSPEVVERFVRRRVPLLRTDRRGPVEVTLRRGATSLQTGD